MIPKQIQVGGVLIDIKEIEKFQDSALLGKCSLTQGVINIANTANGNKQSESSKYNTFIHECVHAILDTMGEYELSCNEKFVNSFAGFANEIIQSIKSIR
ncbi:MAG: hypothetical protein ACI4TK_17830 [Agathobacter sp.]